MGENWFSFSPNIKGFSVDRGEFFYSRVGAKIRLKNCPQASMTLSIKRSPNVLTCPSKLSDGLCSHPASRGASRCIRKFFA
jgi:hypothetical protein